jgi:hypothetical protein
VLGLWAAAAACGLVLAGCETLVPVGESAAYMPPTATRTRTDTALLKMLPPPMCDARSAPAPGKGSEADRLRRLDYEAQCYRHAEMIARLRLRKLQASVRKQATKPRKQEVKPHKQASEAQAKRAPASEAQGNRVSDLAASQ